MVTPTCTKHTTTSPPGRHNCNTKLHTTNNNQPARATYR